jgi:hypothetical protein
MTINQPRWVAESVFILPTMTRLRILRCCLLFTIFLCYGAGRRTDALLLLLVTLINELWIVSALLREWLRRNGNGTPYGG